MNISPQHIVVAPSNVPTSADTKPAHAVRLQIAGLSSMVAPGELSMRLAEPTAHDPDMLHEQDLAFVPHEAWASAQHPEASLWTVSDSATVWACGALCATMLRATIPYTEFGESTQHSADLLGATLWLEHMEGLGADVPEALKRLLKSATHPEPGERVSYQSFRAELQQWADIAA
jgi:hypothetical protein